MDLSDPISLDSRRSRILGALALVVPLLIYIPLIPLDSELSGARHIVQRLFDYELLHPPGYPLFWLLGLLPARIAFGATHFNVTLLTTALPVAMSSWLLYRCARHLDVHPYIAGFASLIWASGPATLVLATHAGVHGFDAMILTALCYTSLRYIKDPAELRWLFAFAALTALGSAHHINFLSAWSALGFLILLTEWRLVTRVKIMAGLLAFMVIPFALYLVLLVARTPSGEEPLVLAGMLDYVFADRLVEHLAPERLGSGLFSAWTHWFKEMFFGAPLLAIFGVWHMTALSWPRRWLLVAIALISPPMTLLMLSLHPEFAEFMVALMAPLSIFTALGMQAVVNLEFWGRSARHTLALKGLIGIGVLMACVHLYRAITAIV